MKDAANALRWCVGEMERRYKLMSAVGVRNLKGYNDKVLAAIEEGEPCWIRCGVRVTPWIRCRRSWRSFPTSWWWWTNLPT